MSASFFYAVPAGLALDEQGRMIYWADAALGQIGRAAMDGSGNKEFILENLGRPRTIAVNPSRG